MGEVYAWPEGMIYAWTGTATASALAGLAQDTRAAFDYGVDNYQTLDTVWHNQYTGQRVDITVGTLYAPDISAWQTMAEAKTGVHMHFRHYNSANGGSAGYLVYSGAFDRLNLVGSRGDFYKLTFEFHANVWTAYNK